MTGGGTTYAWGLPPGFAGAVTNTGTIVTERKYLPTLAELLDRLAIVMLKSIHIDENRKAYLDEIGLIEHDINALLNALPARGISFDAYCLRAIMVLMLTNVTIWNNESLARKGGSEQDKLLKFTHSINGVRSVAKNIIAHYVGERVDLKVDSLAANLPEQFGNWDIFS